MCVDSVCELLVWEVFLVDLGGDDGLQRAFHGVTTEVVRAGPLIGVEEDVRFAEPSLG
jgi:hypothetical protein